MYKFQDIKIHFQKVIPNWSKEVFVIKKIKDTTLWTYAIEDLNSFHATGFFLYLLKALENQRFSGIFRGYKRDQWPEMS